MLRFGLLSLLALFTTGCGELTHVPAPPVPLSAIDATVDDGPMSGPPKSVQLAKALPHDALLTVHVPHLGGTVRRFRKTSLYRMFNSPELRNLFGPVTANFAMLSIGGPNGMNNALKQIQGEFALSIDLASQKVLQQLKTELARLSE